MWLVHVCVCGYCRLLHALLHACAAEWAHAYADGSHLHQPAGCSGARPGPLAMRVCAREFCQLQRAFVCIAVIAHVVRRHVGCCRVVVLNTPAWFPKQGS
ncbi:hypothetical protein COO60DRAFT_1203535 [Scenedesmus sp. NREL 46B-D3]|nr:hypothetical protein COO60DRAFT_1203535 [Scenedesmus sp. NREL 46B-D3]